MQNPQTIEDIYYDKIDPVFTKEIYSYRGKRNDFNDFRGITYPSFLQHRLFQWLWRKYMCSREIHLFDEVLSSGDHSLVCDCCQLVVNIESIDDQYVNFKEEKINESKL